MSTAQEMSNVLRGRLKLHFSSVTFIKLHVNTSSVYQVTEGLILFLKCSLKLKGSKYYFSHDDSYFVQQEIDLKICLLIFCLQDCITVLFNSQCRSEWVMKPGGRTEASREHEQAQLWPLSAEFIHFPQRIGFGSLIFCNEAGMF